MPDAKGFPDRARHHAPPRKVHAAVRRYLAAIGSRGGSKSRRALSAQTARDMVRLREARRAFRKFRVSCFWSYDPNRRIVAADIPWLAEQLRKNGGRDAWETAGRLCP